MSRLFGALVRRCIYCLEEKDETAFTGREHVLPQAFGTFDGFNFVLRCVCDDCNGFFGKTIDRKIARDSAEGVDRVLSGLKPAAEYEHLGKKSTLRVEITEGPYAGLEGYLEANPSGDRPRIVPFPSVVFGRSAFGPFEPYRLERLPTRDELIARGYEKGSELYVHVIGTDWQTAQRALEAKGFSFGAIERLEDSPPLDTNAPNETVAQIMEAEFRVATKIALNYFAAVAGCDVALMSGFDDARNFARHGSSKARIRVHPFENMTLLGRRGSYISLVRWQELIVVQLSILLRTQYFVVLSDDGYRVPLKSSAHFFDLDTRKIQEIEPLPLNPGRRLKSISQGGVNEK